MWKKTAEELIAHLRRRKLRITFYGIYTIVNAVFTVAWGYLAIRSGTNLIVDPSSADIEGETTMLTVMGPLTALIAASCFAMCLAHIIGLGFVFAMLIIELTSCTKDQLLVEMWDRIKTLEERIGST